MCQGERQKHARRAAAPSSGAMMLILAVLILVVLISYYTLLFPKKAHAGSVKARRMVRFGTRKASTSVLVKQVKTESRAGSSSGALR